MLISLISLAAMGTVQKNISVVSYDVMKMYEGILGIKREKDGHWRLARGAYYG